MAMPAYRAYSAPLAERTIRVDAGAAPTIAGKRVGTFLQAVRAFGPPALVVPVRRPPLTCRASWPASGLEIDFSIARPQACAARDLRAWSVVRAQGARWRSEVGLRVGDAARRLHALYPQTRRLNFLGLGPLWQLQTGGPLCDGGPPLALAARVQAGRIRALEVIRVPACG
jgi:hypothetical protein